MPQPRHSKPPADRRREALADELLRAQQRPIEEARAWWLSIYAILTVAVVFIVLVAVLILLVAS